MTAASKIVAFPQRSKGVIRNNLAALDRDDLGPNVREMIEYRHMRRPIEASRSPELLVALCLLKAMPDDTRREVRRQIAMICDACPDDEIARVAMTLAVQVF